MQVIGYTRVSSKSQRLYRQLCGVKLDRVFSDTVSGASWDRLGFRSMLDYIRAGDVVVIHSVDRLARTIHVFIKMCRLILDKGASIRFLAEEVVVKDEDSMGKMLSIAHCVEFEYTQSRKRMLEGIAIAKARGLYKGGKPKYEGDDAAQIVARVRAGEKVAKVARDFGISRQTVYTYLAKDKEAG